MSPKKMRYDSQAILLLAPDLMPDAQHLQQKREAAGDIKNAFDFNMPKSRIFQHQQITVLPIEYRQNTSRIFVLGHGDPGSTKIFSARNGGQSWDPAQLHAILKAWMTTTGYQPSKVQRISLLMCYGGGNRGGNRGKNAIVAGSGLNQTGFQVKPENSFAHNFARIAGTLTVDVTARTDVGQGSTSTINGQFSTYKQLVAGRHHGEGDKFVFTTVDGSTPTNPQNPTYQATWKTSA